jgi:hypothetical protein
MALNSNATATYGVTTIREDIHDALTSITPTATVLMSAIGTSNVDNTYFEWTETDLAAVNSSNRVLEGEASPGNDTATLGVRKGGYTQLSDKVVEITSTQSAVDSVGKEGRMAKQMAYKLLELRKDMETMMLDNVAANAGATGTARVTAGLPAYLTSNVSRGTGGANGTTSGSGSSGHVNAAATDASDGNKRAITETLLKGVIADCWSAGAEPSIVLCGPSQKQTISAFTGNATRFKEAEDSKINAAIDVYISDFGELQIVPTRLQRARDVFVLDPNFAEVVYLQTAKQDALAKTGHSERRLVSVEYGLKVTSEKAHGVVADVS